MAKRAQEATMVIKIKPKAGRVTFSAEGNDSKGKKVALAGLGRVKMPADLQKKQINKTETCTIFYTNPCVYFMHGGRWYRVCY
jgi:hypothetical protein